MSESNFFLLFPTLSGYLEQLGFKNYGNGKKIKCFDNMAKMYTKSYKIKGKFSKNQKQVQDCLMKIIVHTLSLKQFQLNQILLRIKFQVT